MGGMLPEEHRDDVREEAEGGKALAPSAPHNSITTLCDMPSVGVLSLSPRSPPKDCPPARKSKRRQRQLQQIAHDERR